MNPRPSFYLPLLHTLVEERAGLPAVLSAVGSAKAEALAKAGGEEVPFSMEVHGKEASHHQIPLFRSQPFLAANRLRKGLTLQTVV
jgi:hypothetical protein